MVESSNIFFSDYDAAGKAAKIADRLAKDAAESERESQSAWQAGRFFADKKEEARELRKQTQDILAERRKAKSFGGFPALCAALKSTISDNLADIRKLRKSCAELASGDHDDFGFFEGEQRLREAFNEGANQQVLK